MLHCIVDSAAYLVSIWMHAVENGVHLVIRERAVRASKGGSSFIWVAKTFGTIATIPAFVQTMSKDSSSCDRTVAA